jgi:hypothetical protein
LELFDIQAVLKLIKVARYMEKLAPSFCYKNTIAGLLEINKLLFGQLCTERMVKTLTEQDVSYA